MGLKTAVAGMKAAIFDPSAKTFLLTDASPVWLGAVLMQKKEERGDPEIIAFASHSLSATERNYSQIEREALGLVWGCDRFKMYLLGRPFVLLTDHKPLELILGPKSRPNARLERWLMKLQCYNYSIRHVAGTANIADPFSHLLQSTPARRSCIPTVEHAVFHVVESAVPKKFHLDDIREQTHQDVELQAVLQAIKNDEKLPPDFVRLRYELTECQGILLRGDRIVPHPLFARQFCNRRMKDTLAQKS